MGIRISIAEDPALLRAGLTELLTGRGHQVVAAVDNADDLLASVVTDIPDVVILDNRMPPTHTSEGIRAFLVLRTAHPDIGVDGALAIRRDALRLPTFAGAPSGTGCLLKDRVADVATFIQALARIAAGKTVLDPEVVRQLMSVSNRAPALQMLAPREQSVLELMAQGRTNAGICAQLLLSAGAVEKNITAVFSKPGLEPSGGDHRRVLAVLEHLERA